MFDPTSRYANLEQAALATADGRTVAYVRRRFLPRGETLPLLTTVTVTDGDRLDLIAARTLGDARQFWRVCDAMDALVPRTLTADPGRALRVPIPQVEA